MLLRCLQELGRLVAAPRAAVAGITLIILGLAAPTLPAGAQAAPTGGINIVKVEIGGVTPATFEVTGPGITGTAALTANVLARTRPRRRCPPCPRSRPAST